MDMMAAEDRRRMRAALALARRGLGRVAPNPAVGCVIVRDGRVVGRGWTQPGGRPHAEAEALARAGTRARGGTAYVSLEPCAHHGAAPPCADALIAAGVSRVVAALEDPDPRVAGRGLARLRAAGIAVESGVCAEEAAALNEGFFRLVTHGRPMVTLKLAVSLDGRIAARTGDSRWITGAVARSRGHLLRATHDAVAIGSGTALADDPALTCRLPGLAAQSPIRVVFDRRLRLAPRSALARTAQATPVWVLATEGAESARREALEAAGVVVLTPGSDSPLDALRVLGERGVTRLLVEGGGALAASLIAEDLVDRIALFRAPVVLGGDGWPAVAALGLDRVAEARRYRSQSVEPLGQDLLEVFVREGDIPGTAPAGADDEEAAAR